MEELSQLKKSVLKKKPQRNPIPRAVNYWLFFKRYILEPPDVRAQFAEADPPLDLAGFQRLVRRVANPAKWGPSFCRPRRGGRSAQTAKRNTNDMLAVLWRYYEVLLHPASPLHVAESETMGGLGLFARHGAVLRDGGHLFVNHLWGVPFEVSADCFVELQASGYPSLYRTPDERCHILCGPLALVNHQCTSPLAFSLPRKVDSSRRGSSSSRRRSQGGLALEEFDGLRAVYVRAAAGCRVRRGQEIMVKYADVQPRQWQTTEKQRRRRRRHQALQGSESDGDGDSDNDAGSPDGLMTFAGAPCRCQACSPTGVPRSSD